MAEQYDMYEIENSLRADGFMLIAGVDEAGRGPLAGPVCAAAVIFPEGCVIEGLNDSKKLTEKKREKLYDEIIKNAAAWSVSTVDEKTIDRVNILNATHTAMNDAVNTLSVRPDYVIIDGNSIKNMTLPHKTIVKGDAKCAAIAAASILAKVSRDRYMTALAEKYPEYGFEKHKGYGTKAHYAAIEKYGVTDIHRRTFLKKILGDEK